jgi:predicted Zn finger-like uncharacterized protein
MILTCPSCATRYQTDGASFKAPGRNVRCAKCGKVWFQAPPDLEPGLEPEAIIAPAASIAPPPMEQPAQPLRVDPGTVDPATIDFAIRPSVEEAEQLPARRPPRSRGAAFAQSVGWMALIFLIGAVGWATVHYRETIAAVWPQSASLYAVLGLPVNVRGIALTNIAYKQEYEDGQPVLSVTGKVVNVSARNQAVPEIRVVLLDDAKHELYHWTFDAGIPALKPGSESPFMTRLSSPPPEARNLNVRFAEAGDTR